MPLAQQVMSKPLLNGDNKGIEIDWNLVLCIIFQSSETSRVVALGNDDSGGDCDGHSSWLVPQLGYYPQC